MADTANGRLWIRQAALGVVLCTGLVLATWGLGAYIEDMSSHDDFMDGFGAAIGAMAMAIGLTMSGLCACGLAWPTQTWKALRWTARKVVLPLIVLQAVVVVFQTVVA